MGVRERQRRIVEYLSVHRFANMSHLADIFGVSVRTIQRDLDALSFHYPIIITKGRYTGGVSLVEGFRLERNYLTIEEQTLLEKLLVSLSGNDQIVMKKILGSFVPPGR